MDKNFEWDTDFELGFESAGIAAHVWPNFLSKESDPPQPGLKLEIDELTFRTRYPAWGLRASETGQLVAYANAVMIELDSTATELPDSGWQYAIEAGARQMWILYFRNFACCRC